MLRVWRNPLTSNGGKTTFKELPPLDDGMVERAAQTILLLPLNWRSTEEEPVYSVSTESVTKLLSQNKVASQTLSPITPGTRLRDERAMDWVGPTLFVSGAMLSQNPMAVNFALNIMANYATDLFKGLRSDPNVKLSVVQTEQKGKKSREVHYEGPASGLPALAKVLTAFERTD
jgi:hypothetical protein